MSTPGTTPVIESVKASPPPVPAPDETDHTVPEVLTFREIVEEDLRKVERGANALLDALHSVVSQLQSAHQAALVELTDDAEGPAERWAAVRKYRTRVSQDVIAFVKDEIDRLRVAESLIANLDACHDDLNQNAEALPALIHLPDVTSIYRIADDDTMLRRGRKRFERTKRMFRRFGHLLRRRIERSSEGGSAADERLVELRRLAAFHVRVRLVPEIEKTHAVVQRAVVQGIGRLEEALTRWALALLALEHRLDTPAYHRPATANFPPAAESTDDADPVEETVETEPLDLATEFGERLDGILVGLREVRFDLADLRDDVGGGLDRDIGIAGTFLLSHRSRRVKRRVRRDELKRRDRRARFVAWHNEALAKISGLQSLAQLRENLLNIQDALLQRMAQATLQPVFGAFSQINNGLQRAINETEVACIGVGDKPHPAALVDALRGIQGRTLSILRRTLRDVPGVVSAHEALNQPGKPEWEQMLQLIECLPGRVSVHRLPEPDEESVDLDARRFPINLREIARDALDPPLPQQLAKDVRPLSQRIVQVWDETAKVEDIIKFNLDATLEELTDESRADEPREGGATEVERAEELATDALRRSIDTLDDLSSSLADPWSVLEEAVFETFQGDWVDVQRRVGSEGAVEERWVGVQTRFNRAMERSATTIGHRVAAGRERLTRWGKVWSRSFRRLVARGQAAVGVAESREDESIVTLDEVSDLPRLQGELPLVYRKLFSFEPVTEISLFEGRSRDLVRVRRHFDRWQGRHDSGVMVLSAALGGGRTSFLNAVRSKVFTNADVTFVPLDKRVKTLDEFADKLVQSLGVKTKGVGIRDLEQTLLSQTRDDVPRVCLLDNLEHLILQGVASTELIEEVLMFLSRTDTVIYWVTTIGREAWYFVEKTARSAVGFVTHHPLTPIDRPTIEEIVMSRHRRSGIPVTFSTPKALSPILRQRLRRARTDQRRQEILRKDYFDALHAATNQNLKLSFFYWIRCADFVSVADELTIAAMEPLSFRFLDSLDPTRSFSLKAFIVHNTMTVEEHSFIFRLPVGESTFILESLLNQRLIEPVLNEGQQHDDVAGVQAGQSYRIPRLILEPVLKHLRNKHFVY